MKKYYFFVLLLTQIVFSQAPIVEWQKTLGGTSGEYVRAIRNTPDGGYIVAGQTDSYNAEFSSNHGSTDALIVKLSSAGTIEWQKTLGGSSIDVAFNIQLTLDGGYILVGYSTSNNGDVSGNHGGEDVWVAKLSSVGIIEWQKSYGGTQYDYGFDIKVTSDGGYVFVGHAGSNNGDVSGNHGNYDVWVVKISSIGVIQWQKALGGTNVDYAESIQVTADGGYILAGHAFSNNGDVSGNHQPGTPDLWVVKLSPTGSVEWQKSLGGTGSEYGKNIELTSDGGYIVGAYTSSNNGDVSGLHGSFYDFWVVKLSENGTIQWQRALGGSYHDNLRNVKTTSDGGYIAIGMVGSSDGDVEGDHPTGEVWIVKLSNTGIIQWQKSLGGSNVDDGINILANPDGSYTMIGWTNSTDGDVIGAHGDFDGWVVKLGPDALATSNFNPQNIKLYPNPTASFLTLQSAGNILFDKIVVTDLAGKTILEQYQNSNQINVEKLAGGIYILQAFSGEEKLMAKFIKE
ncbi:T9SS type A sorting domain-containing protein [Flavobacterium terrisoli]|uniref:T9SS type A sorting domain-containing protein n=1 Tax=Flavobacterium terrisoli TaxID=3242195 RepID=UPI002543EEFE|nr:T9SS type A sorting domain-containing protein [Flavobacterium buctense]